MIVHCKPLELTQFVHATNEWPLLGAAVRVMGPLPTAKGSVQFEEQTIFDGDTVTVPEPDGVIRIVSSALFPVDPVKHTTFVFMVPVTTAPDDDRPPTL